MNIDEEKQDLAAKFLEVYGKMQRMKMNTVHPDLSQGEYYLLASVRYIAQREESNSVCVAALVEKQHVSPQAVSKMLRGLEDREYICRITCKRDRRTSLVQLTDKGKNLLEEAGIAAGKFADHVIKSMGCTKVEQLLPLLQELDRAVQEELDRFEESIPGGTI